MMLYLSLGTNLGDKHKNLQDAIQQIEQRIGHVVAQSAVIATQPWGYKSENEFLNACVAVETTMSPRDILHTTQAIERALGRTQKSRGTYHDRLIDIDILMLDDLIVDEKDLKIPHPLMRHRLFVLQPLAEIAQNVMVPGSSMSVGEMFKTLETDS
jgi:2-amino-4-hydroxy-6-hydroxymethyldihydropteridine diphosphokinase